MKKKIFMLIIAAAAIVCTAVAAGCGGNGNTGDANFWSAETAYAEAQSLGYGGTLEEFLATVKGADGVDGVNGKDGKDGVSVTHVYVNNKNELTVLLSDGKIINCGVVKGEDGRDGKDGADGIGVKTATINADGELIVTLTNGKEINCGSAKGADGVDGVNGKDGADGIGVKTATINADGELIVTLTNGKEINCGSVKGADGVDGVNGKDGAGIEKIETAGGKLVITLTNGTRQTFAFPQCPHIYSDWEENVAATCTSMGCNARTCAVCGDVEYDFVAPLGHRAESYTNNNTYHSFACDRCGLLIDEMHSYDDGRVCTLCGYGADYSVGLSYVLNKDGNSYSVVGTGDCTDTEIVIPESYMDLPVTRIGDGAFSHCEEVLSVTLPDTITYVSHNAFVWCGAVEEIVSDGEIYYSKDNCLIERSSKTLVFGCKTSIIPADGSVSIIGDNAFRGCSGLTNIDIPDGVTTIGSSSFAECGNLTTVSIGKDVSYVTRSAFVPDSAMTCVTVAEDNASYSSSEGILYDKQKTEIIYVPMQTQGVVVLPYGLKTIGDSVFSYCSGITGIVIPDSVESIGASAFRSCSGLTELNIPQGVKSIGRKAFESCRGLTKIDIPESVTEIDRGAFLYCDSLTEATIRSAKIGFAMFTRCDNLIRINILGEVTEIEGMAFAYCRSLKEIAIPDSVQFIGSCAFFECSGLESITLGSGLVSVDRIAFERCDNLTEVYYADTEEMWNAVVIDKGNDALTSAAVYFYSGEEPALNQDGTAYDGNYWHYDTDGVTPVVWTKQGGE